MRIYVNKVGSKSDRVFQESSEDDKEPRKKIPVAFGSKSSVRASVSEESKEDDTESGGDTGKEEARKTSKVKDVKSDKEKLKATMTTPKKVKIINICSSV